MSPAGDSQWETKHSSFSYAGYHPNNISARGVLYHLQFTISWLLSVSWDLCFVFSPISSFSSSSSKKKSPPKCPGWSWCRYEVKVSWVLGKYSKVAGGNASTATPVTWEVQYRAASFGLPLVWSCCYDYRAGSDYSALGFSSEGPNAAMLAGTKTFLWDFHWTNVVQFIYFSFNCWKVHLFLNSFYNLNSACLRVILL